MTLSKYELEIISILEQNGVAQEVTNFLRNRLKNNSVINECDEFLAKERERVEKCMIKNL